MKKFKNYKKQLGFALGLIAVFSIFQNGTCKNQAIVKSTGLAQNLNTLTLSHDGVTISENSSIQFVVSGGTPPYSYHVYSGAGSISASGKYYSTTVAGPVTIAVYDSEGISAFSNITVSSSTSGAAPLSISPAVVSVVKSGTHQFVATGGTPPYMFSVTTGIGGSINASTGLYTAAANSGSEVIKVLDSAGAFMNATVTVTDTAALSVVPAVASVVKGGTITLVASGGSAPYVFSIYSGIGSVGASTGVYTAPQSTGSAIVKVIDHANTIFNVAINVTAPTSPLVVTPTTKRVPVLSRTTLTVSGGTPPYRFAKISGDGSVVISNSNTTQAVYTALNAATAAVIEVSDSASVPARVRTTINVIATSDAGAAYLVNLDSVMIIANGVIDLEDRCSVVGMKFPLKLLNGSGAAATSPTNYILQKLSDNTADLASNAQIAGSFYDFTNTIAGIDMKINSARKWTDNSNFSMSLKFAVVSPDQKIQYQCLSIAPSTSKLSCKQTAKVWVSASQLNQWQISKLGSYTDGCDLYAPLVVQ